MAALIGIAAIGLQIMPERNYHLELMGKGWIMPRNGAVLVLQRDNTKPSSTLPPIPESRPILEKIPGPVSLRLTDEDLSVFGGLDCVTEIYIQNKAFQDINALSGMHNLRVLDLSFTSTGDLSALTSLQGLSDLRLRGTNVSDDDIEDITNLQKLDSLDLRDTNVTEISKLSRIKTLHSLFLHGSF